MTNNIFLCGKARMRSPTATALTADWPNIQSDYAGLSNDADEPVALDYILWAEDICVMEHRQKKHLNGLFTAHLRDKTIGMLNIPDIYNYMDPDLIDRLKKRLAPKYNP